MLNSCVMPLGAYQTNCYLLWQEDREDCLVIDPGYEPDKVLDKLDRLGKRSGRAVTGIHPVISGQLPKPQQ